MKGVIIYNSKYGATEQYAKWLSESLEWPVYTPETLTYEALEQAETVVVGSSVYVGHLRIKSWLENNMGRLERKKLFFFVVMATPHSERPAQLRCAARNIPANLLRNNNAFFLGGRLIKKRLSWVDRLLVKMGARAEKDPVKRANMELDFDRVQRTDLNGLLQAVVPKVVAEVY
ncbi:MAG: flavodoxin domain-containing protein [Candidatus Pseudobacter hemicellulosilyticus]|uniref:Flavodoxin domain-containing protein n=1 Tax=Candidatus Pseudobacter hemicellulosilyticus TaxID=3121375 RepID=A0AAJ5WRS9_9BACT|nr:MAG: flavodoxin domain-containing protein [Pseudobacter sp.]